ncbi:hypothetical protein ACI7RC_12700 [Brevibacillus sp. B_LB10_24]|uniref:hypothetical protein n=1 Tax=Brevibacillus sp. B_LB10_24 TaxID=3380645 RepID=UPI0038B94B9B
MENLLNKFSNEDRSLAQILIYEIGITSVIWFILNFEKLQEEVISEKMPFENLEEGIADFVIYGLLGEKQHR